MSATPISSPDRSASVSSDEELRRLEGILGESISPLIVQARAKFRGELPGLLRDHPDQWVAYHGDQRIGLGPSKDKLVQQCLGRGLKRDQFLVLFIEPEPCRDVEVPVDV